MHSSSDEQHITHSQIARRTSTLPETTADGISDLLNPTTSNSNHRDIAEQDEFDHQILVRPQTESTHARDSSGSLIEEEFLKLRRHTLSRPVCLRLLELYLEKLEWMHHIIDVPSFCTWCRDLWSDRPKRGRHDLLRLALLFSILCLSVHFELNKEIRTEIQLYVQPDSTYHRYSQAALVAADYLRCHSLAAIQVLITQGLYLVNIGESDAHHANLAIAIRMANTLGISKLDHDSPAHRTHLNANLARSPAEDELGRRVYWSLICQDAYTASSCNFTYTVPANQIRCQRPANLNDNELYDTAKPAHDLDRPTSMSYHVAKIDFALVAKRSVDLYNDHALDHAQTIELESELWMHYDRLPSYLRPDLSELTHNLTHSATLGWGDGLTQAWDPITILTNQLRWQRLFMGITLHNRIMRLHRPFLARGYLDPKFRASRIATVKSAHALMDLIARGRQISFPGLRWWVVLVHIFTAAVTLCVDRLLGRHSQLSSEGSEQHSSQSTNIRHSANQSMLDLALDVLQDAASHSRAASQAVHIIQRLMQRSQAPSASRPRKRKDNEHAHSSADRPANKQTRTGSTSTSTQYPQQPQSELSGTSSQASSSPVRSDTWQSDIQQWMGSEWMGLFEVQPPDGQDESVGQSGSLHAGPDALSSELWNTIESFANSIPDPISTSQNTTRHDPPR